MAAVRATLRARRAAEVVRFDEFREIGAAHEFAGVAERVVEIEVVDAELVGDGRIAVVRHAARDPMVAADGLDIPDFVHIGDDDAVRFVCSVRFEQLREALDAFARGVDVWQDEGDDVFLADAAGDFRRAVGLIGRLQHDHRIGGEHTFVDRDGFGGAHRHIAFADARFGEDAAVRQHVRHDAVPAWVVGQVDFDMAEHAAVVARLVLGRDRHELLRIIAAGTGVIVAGDDGGAVVAGFFAYKNRCA